MVPVESLKKFSPDITVCVDLALTRNIFSKSQISAKKVINSIKDLLFIDELKKMYDKLLSDDFENDSEKTPTLFSVWGRSLDIAIFAKRNNKEEYDCDLMIKPRSKDLNTTDLRSKSMERYYNVGREVGLENIKKIKSLIASKT